MNESVTIQNQLTQGNETNSEEFIDDVFGGSCTGTRICVCTYRCCITRWSLADGSEESDSADY
jgi:hypothetical protein